MNQPKKVTYCGIDSWNRPVFKAEDGKFYGAIDTIFDYDTPKQIVLDSLTDSDLTYFGDHFGCEPMGSKANVTIDRSQS